MQGNGGRTTCDCSQLGHFGLLFVRQRLRVLVIILLFLIMNDLNNLKIYYSKMEKTIKTTTP